MSKLLRPALALAAIWLGVAARLLPLSLSRVPLYTRAEHRYTTPDGREHVMSPTGYQWWRKNRSFNAGGTRGTVETLARELRAALRG